VKRFYQFLGGGTVILARIRKQ